MSFNWVPSYVQVESEPILNASGIVYGSAAAWEEGDLDPWRSEVIGNVEGPEGQRYAPNLRGFMDYIADISKDTRCSQVATIFVINSDTVKYHITGQPTNWAAGWNFDYRFSKPYCTVERTGNTMNESNFRYVAMHELFHLFGAADEYDGSSDCVDPANCGLAKYGMLKAANNNCHLCAGLNQVPCVMLDPIHHHTVCWYTRQMLGWVDPDGNGGGLVDDMPVDHTALVTGDFNFGDFFEVRTLNGYFVNAFRVSSYNSYPRPDGKRTVQVLGMNYAREKIAPDIYYGIVNGGSPFTFTLSFDNGHPPLTITDYSSYGPYFRYTLNYVGHSNMKIRNPHTGEWWQVYTGELLAGQNTLHEFLWRYQDWVKDGSYTNENRAWVCDGVNKPLSDSQHVIAYGPPSNWDMRNITYNPEIDRVTAYWQVGSWSEDAWVMQNSDTLASLNLGPLWGYAPGASWFNPIGSDSCDVYVAAVNPNGQSHSDTLTYLTEPNIPEAIQFSDVIQTICQPIPDNTVPIYDPKYTAPCDTASHKINALAISCAPPAPQRIENIDGYLIRLGHYIEKPPGSNNFVWQNDSVFLRDFNGSLVDTIYGLDPNKQYSANIFTIDRFGQESPWGLPVYENILVGELPWNESNPPSDPSGNAGKLPNTPISFSIENFPNPFNAVTVINYSLPRRATVSVDIFNILGQKVKTLVQGEKPAGYHSVLWDGKNEAGIEVGSGIYFYRLKAGQFTQSKKMLLLK
ncbi:MAG: T9SS type A sorting domain-containing protein [bacterium]